MPKGKTEIKKKRGNKPLAEGQDTERVTCNLPEDTFAKAKRKAGRKGMSAYLRTLVEADICKAS